MADIGYAHNSPEDAAKHVPKAWTRANVLEQLGKDIAFGFEKGLGQRGISASLMAEVVGMWLWVLGDTKGVQVLQDQYAQYGLPVFKYAATTYGFPNPIGEDTGTEAKYSCGD